MSCVAPSSGYEPLQRLGDCAGFGEALIEILELNGWTVHRRPAFGGGVLLIATHPSGWDVRAGGATTAGAASELFQRAAQIIAPQDDDLRLFA